MAVVTVLALGLGLALGLVMVLVKAIMTRPGLQTFKDFDF
jgi:hypothetical protein